MSTITNPKIATTTVDPLVEACKVRLCASLKEYGKQMRLGNPKQSAQFIEFGWMALNIMSTLDKAGSDGDDEDFDALYSMKLAYEIFKGSPFREKS